jgi:zinc protease
MRFRGVCFIALLAPHDRLCAVQAPIATPPISGAPTPNPSLIGAVRPALARVVHDTTLANGLAVIAIENHSVPLATVEVVVRTGAFTQDPGTEGVPHLFEHMLFKSFVGANQRSFGENATELDAIHNGTTAEEQVTYYLTLPSVFVDRAMELLAQLLRDPVFTQQDLNDERRVVENEFDRDRSDPDYRLQREVERRLWTTAWGRKNPLGEIEAIDHATPKLLREIFHRYYLPNNAALVVSGDVTFAQVFAFARRRFDNWSRGPDPFISHPTPPFPALSRSASIVAEDDVKNVTLRLEWQGPGSTLDRPGTYAADVLGSIVNAPGSALQRRLVDSGLFTSVALTYATLGNAGPITLYATTVVDSLPRALGALGRELTDLGGPDAFSEDELANSKQSRAVDAAFELDHPTGMAHTVGFWWSVAGLDYYLDYTARMAGVTRRQLQRYVHRYMIGAPAVAGFLVPRGTSGVTQNAIAAFMDQSPMTPGPSAAGSGP